MHTTNLDLSIEEITKIEGAATCEIKIRDGKLTECHFGIAEMRRFFEEAIRGKPISNVPHLVARICGTCSNAHLLCSIKSIENGLNLIPSPQTQLLRQLVNYGLIIRDHGLHLYVFVLPDIYKRDSILAFDENNPEEHELLHDCFAVKEVGNKLGIVAGGRSVHAPFLRLGGFSQIPTKESLTKQIAELESVRPRILKLIEIFGNCNWKLKQELQFLALADDVYSFLNGKLTTSGGQEIAPEDFEKHLTQVDIPYSQATGYLFDGKVHFVGALARMNLNREKLHERTRKDAAKWLGKFPSNNIHDNNLAQAIEMLHAVDSSIDLINKYEEVTETETEVNYKATSGYGVIEAPRGTLYHKVEMDKEGSIIRARIIVPTGQNQIGIERAIADFVSLNITEDKEWLQHEIEKIIRSYDPCMSCATHFLQMKWDDV